MNDIIRFCWRGKLNPRYIRPFHIFQIVQEIEYIFALLTSFLAIHPIFRVSMLRKNIPYV